MASSNSVGTAYLTLVPKLDSNMSEMDNGMSEAGKSGGNAFTAGFKKVAGAIAFAEIGKKAADIFMEAFNGAAEFEQLAGGVEKIFDEFDNATVMNDARNAWMDMNMSANDYLAIMNDVGAMFSATMGDEKAYNTAKMGLQAIADYASGTGKNVTELDQKFAMITRSTSSYQSIADQFAGILPATSKDFLSAAQNAGYLGKQYQELTKVPVAEYQQAVSLMLRDGVENLNLTGNTSKETEKTVSGSIAGTKAAWSNLVVSLGIGGDTMKQDLKNFVGQFGHMAENIVTLAGEIFTNLMELLSTELPSIFSNIGSYIGDNLPVIITNVIEFIVDAAPDILAAASELFFNIVSGLLKTIPELVSRIPEMIQKVVEKIMSYSDHFGEAGANLIMGMVKGIGSAATWVIDKVKELCSNALDALKSFFGIHSPSRVMRQMGGYIGEGLALGIEDSESVVGDAMDGLMSTAAIDEETLGFAAGGSSTINIHELTVNAEDARSADAFTAMLRRASMQYA